MVVAWQTDESSPNPGAFTVQFGKSVSYGQSVTPQGRVVDNYLSADPALPVPPTASGPHSNYAAVLKGLRLQHHLLLSRQWSRHAERRLRSQFPHAQARRRIFIPGAGR